MDMNVQRENKIIDYIEKVYHIRKESSYVVHSSKASNIDYIVDVYEYAELDGGFDTVTSFIVYSNGDIEYSHMIVL